MEPLPFEQHLRQAGLTSEQSRVYEALLEKGPSLASDAARKAGISRTLTYKVLGELSELGLAEKREESGKVAVFVGAHPLKLKELIEKRQADAKDALYALEGVMGSMTSTYNLAGGKPSVEFKEGRAGVEDVLNQTLSSKEEIYTYADTEAIQEHVADINAAYVEKRKRRGIKKKILMIDSPLAQKNMAANVDPLTQIRIISAQGAPRFASVLEIYDGKVGYLSFAEKNLTATVVYGEEIYKLHRYLFEALWERATTA